MLAAFQNRAYKRAIADRLSGTAPGCEVPAGGKAQMSLHRALFALMGRLSKIDGRVSSQEVDYATSVMQLLDLSPRQRQEAIDYFELGKQLDTDVLLLIEELVAYIGRGSELARLFMKVQLRLVFCKGSMRLKEKMLLRDAAEVLGFDKPTFLEFCAEFHSGHQRYYGLTPRSSGLLVEAYNTLRLLPDARNEEVRPAYLRLMTRYHPDKLNQENLSEEAMREAQEKASKIRSAYEEICEARRMRA